jgi:thiamine-phosphate pyrophosphorylase
MSLSPLNAILDFDAAAARGWRLPDLARAFLDGGARFLQVRAKSLDSGPLLEIAEEVVADAHRAGAIVIINDRADLAALAGADGVHVGQTDLAPADVRRLLSHEAIVGFSTHTRDQVDRGRAEPISYLAVGPIFRTATKDTGYEAVGLDLVRHAAAGGATDAKRPAIPVVAIGGITIERAPAVIDAGAASVAMIGELLAGDPAARVRDCLRHLAV